MTLNVPDLVSGPRVDRDGALIVCHYCIMEKTFALAGPKCPHVLDCFLLPQ